MADINILSGSRKGHYRIALHFDVPDVTNSVGVNIRQAIVNSGEATTSAMLPGDGTNGTISAEDVARLAAGELIEKVVSVPLEGEGTTNAIRLAAVRRLYSKENAEMQRQLSERLRYFGFAQDRA